jgi:hypothetical protein
MTEFHTTKDLHRNRSVLMTVAACMVALSSQAAAGATLETEPRVMAQVGLGMALTLGLIENETAIINNFTASPPKCSRLPAAGSIKTLSVTQVSKTEYMSKIETFYAANCSQPYALANVTVSLGTAAQTVGIAETASFLLPNGKLNGTLRISDHLAIVNNIETLRGLGVFSPVGGQPAASVGFTCSIPTTNNALTANCKAGIAQRFTSLDLSVASVVPFLLTAAKNTNAPSVKFKGATSSVQTGKAGSLSITAPSANELAIAGGGTAYTSTSVAGSEASFTLFPPEPTLWTVNDAKNIARFSYRLVSNVTHAARAAVTTVSTGKPLASMTLDWSGSGKVAYADGSSALIRNYLAAN